jgi:G3E family GTPase
MDRLLDVGAFDLGRTLARHPRFLTGSGRPHDPGVTAVALVQEGELARPRLDRWLGDLLTTRGPDIYRVKGVLNLQGESRRFVLQGVDACCEGQADREWRTDERRSSQLVVIGTRLDRDALREGFSACFA